MRTLSLVLGIVAGVAAAQDIKLVNGGAWERLQQGGVDAAAGLQVSSQARVVVRGAAPSSRIVYRLVQRVKARSEPEAARRLTGAVTVANSPGVALINAQGSPSYSTLELYVPPQVRNASVEILHSGDIEVYDFRGSVLARTPGGDIQVDNIHGQVSAYTGGGHIRVGKVDGGVECSTGAGSITISHAGAEVNCRTAGGEIGVRDAQGPVWLSSSGGNISVDHASMSVEAHSMQGAIMVGQAGGIVTADTRGGEIRVGSAAGVRAESAAGPVHLMDANGPLSVSTAIGSILAEIMSGARLRDSSLVAASGDITVMIPSNVALSVMATNELGGVPRIESDFSGIKMGPLNFSRPPLAEGIINGGGPVLVLSGSGVIYLKRVR